MRVSEAAYEGHCRHIDRALSRFEDGQFDEALAELDMALEFCDSPNARWNRAQALLALGRYREGWDGYAARWQLFPGAATERGRSRSCTFSDPSRSPSSWPTRSGA